MNRPTTECAACRRAGWGTTDGAPGLYYTCTCKWEPRTIKPTWVDPMCGIHGGGL